MSAIEASSGTYRCRVDGTIVLSVEIEPRFKDAFNALFGTPGTPMAIAALQVGYAAAPVVNQSLTTEKPKGGALSIEAAALCRHPEYLRLRGYESEKHATAAMKDDLCIESRAELDHSESLKERFIRHYRAPFMKHMQARGITT